MNSVKLGDVTKKIGSGATPKGGKHSYRGGDTSLIRSLNVYDEGFQFAGLAKINDEQARQLNNVKVEKGDVLFNITGASVARCCVVPTSVLPARVNQHVSIIRPNEDKLDPRYLHNYLILDNVKSYLLSASGGSSREAITKGQLEDLIIKVPTIEQQRKIANVLSALDDKIELNRKINAELEQMARTLYDYWFVQFDFPDASGKPYKSSGGSMKFSPELNREIPEGWQALKLQDVLEFEKGTEPGADAYSDVNNDEYDLPFYRVGNIDGETDTYIDSSKFNTKTAKPSDVIVTFDGSVGKMGLGLNGAISGGLRHIYDKTGKIFDAGVYAIFRDEYVIKTIERYATGSVILHASSSIPYLAIPYDEKVFTGFQKIIEPMFAKIIANRQQSQKLTELRDWLLPMLMNGQVKVI